MMYGSPPRTILHAIDLEIHEGEFVCVLGQTGCGKSTLLRLILGSEHPSSGRILIDGREHKQPDRARGYVPQKYSLFPDKTVLDNITFGAEVSEFSLWAHLTPRYLPPPRGIPRRGSQLSPAHRAHESDASKYPDQLSGGMQQRVAIAQALMTNPRILLMDEAFSALDPGTRRGMQRLIRDLWKSTGTTILFVTHNMREALELGSRIVVLSKESPDQGSTITLDLGIPEHCEEEDIPALVRQLEDACHGGVELEEAVPQAAGE